MDFSVEAVLRTLQGLPHPPCYWVAFSGGLDSTCLIHALATLRERLSAPLQAVHLDHGLQPDSTRWAMHCHQVCETLGITLTVRALGLHPALGTSIEAAARQARRDAFQALLGADDLLLTGQHRDDQAETILLQLLRGSGLPGLAAMPRLMALPPGWLARPLLDFTRTQLQTYAQEHGLAWVEDPSNHETNFDRNYLRHRVLPLLAQRWPAYAMTLARSAGHCAEAAGLIEQLSVSHLERARGSRPGTLSVAALRDLDPPLCRTLLRRWVREQGWRVPDSRRLERIRRELLFAAPDRTPRVDWPGTEVRRYRDDLFIMGPLPPLPSDSIPWPRQSSCELPTGLGRLRVWSRAGVGLDPVRWQRGVIDVCFGVTGERCRPAGAAHHSRLKDLYRRHEVPDWLRPYVPLVYLDGELVAVAGVCLCGQAVAAGKRRLGLVWEGHSFVPILRLPPSDKA